MKIKHYLFVLMLSLAPMFVSGQEPQDPRPDGNYDWSKVYADDGNPMINNGGKFNFVVDKQTNGVQNLIDMLQDPLDAVLGGVVGTALNTALNTMHLTSLSSILTVLGVISPAPVKIDLGSIYKATIVGMASDPVSNTSFTIPATVWNNNFNPNSVLSLLVNNYQGLNLGVLDKILNASIGNDVKLGLLENLLSITLLDGTTSGVPLVSVYDWTYNGKAYITSLEMSGATNLEYIGSGAFANLPNLTNGGIDLSNLHNLATIGSQAFANCSNLAGGLSLKNDENLITIGDNAFSNCTSLDGTLDLSGLTSLTTIGSQAFYSGADENIYTKLSGTINLSDSKNLTTIGDYAFDRCKNLTGGLDLSNLTNLATIGDGAFANLSGLTGELKLSGLDSLKTIGDEAFNGCSNDLYGSIDLSASTLLKSIGGYSFSNLKGLNGTLSLSNLKALETIGDFAFYGLEQMTGGIDLSGDESLKSIGQYAFASSGDGSSGQGKDGFNGELNMSGLKSLATIANDAFANNYNLVGELNLSDANSLTTIGKEAFANLSKLTGDVKIPSSVNNIGDMAFMGCTDLRSISFNANNITTLGGQLFNACVKLEYIDMSKCSLEVLPGNISRNDTNDSIASKNSTHVESPFYMTPSHTLIYLPLISSETNSLVDALASTNNNENYVVLLDDGNMTCPWLSIEDGTDYIMPYAFTAKKATYNANNANSNKAQTAYRTFTGPTSIYLPYSFNVDSTASSVGIYALGRFNEHDPGTAIDNTFVFQKISNGETVPAYTPCIVRIDGNSGLPQLPDAVSEDGGVYVPASPTGYYDNGITSQHIGIDGTVFADDRVPTSVPVSDGQLPAVKDTDGTIWTLSGTNELVDNATAGTKNTWYFGSDGKWYSSKAGDYDLNQFRVFFIPSNPAATPSAKLFNFSLVDGNGTSTTPTGIGPVNDGRVTGNDAIYTISGQYAGKDINALPKGIYIVNGKKLIK